jgi:DNA invertase Pin-like site-specific DNA recombinase
MKVKDKKERLLKAKIAVALQDEYGRVPTSEEIESVFHLTRVMYKAVLGLHYRRQEQKRSGQLALF